MRRLLLIVLAVALSGCSAAGRPSAARVGPSPRTGHAPQAMPEATASGAPAATDPSASGGGGAPGPAPAPAPAPAEDNGAAARQALHQYLEALAQRNSAEVLATSTGAAAALGAVRLTVAQANAQLGASTMLTFDDGGVSVVSSSPTAAVLGGTVTIRSTVSGPKGSQASTDTIAGPISVVQQRGNWQVSSFAYDGTPTAYVPEGDHETVGGLQLTVAFVLSYGHTTAALVGLAAPQGHVDLRLQRTTLSAGSTGSAPGTGLFNASGQPTGVLSFPRSAGLPTELTASFQRANGTALDFALALSGRSS